MIRILLLALFLASCGGDSGSSTSSSSFFSFLASDPYIVNGTFFYDQDDNGIYDQGEPVSTPTDTSGNGSFSTIIPEGGKIIQLTGGVMDGFNYNGKLKGISNGVGGIVLSPLTTLTANGFTDQQVVELLDDVGISINKDQINQNPMTDPNLLRAALSVAQGLLYSIPGFDLSPSYINSSGGITTFSDNYTQQLFKDAARVYGEVITEEEFNNNLTDLSKTTSSFLNYMNTYGASDFATSTEVQNAKGAIDNVINDSTNSFEPVALEKKTSGFVAKVLKNNWFESGTYDLIGINTIKLDTRITNNTISNYPTSPWKVEINLVPADLGSESMTVLSGTPDQYNYYVDSTNDMVMVNRNITVGDGAQPKNVQEVDGLPISTFERAESILLRGSSKSTGTTINEKDLRLIGDGEDIFTYFGIDWGSVATDRGQWTVNKSRTNNCILGDQPTEKCQNPTPNYYYNTLKENGSIKSINALTEASELGPSLPANTQFKFTIKNQPLGSSATQNPVEFTISEISLNASPTYLVFDQCPNCISVKVGEDIRPPWQNSLNISFLTGYPGDFPNYRVLAVDKVTILRTGGMDSGCDTKSTSSFFKGNMLLIQLPEGCVNSFKIEYIFIDLASRNGVVASPPLFWEENGLVKFKYRNINQINLKEVIP